MLPRDSLRLTVCDAYYSQPPAHRPNHFEGGGVPKRADGGGVKVSGMRSSDRLDFTVLTETGAFIKARMREQDTRNSRGQSDRAYKESR